MNLRGKKSSRAELDFTVPIKSTTRTQGEKGGEGNPKESTEQVNT